MTQAAQVVNPDLKTYVAIVLDQSGSMDSCKTPTILGFNEQVQTIQNNAKNGEQYFTSLIKFNNHVTQEFLNEPVAHLKELNGDTYIPNGGTAMLDGVGHTIDWLKGTTDITDPNNAYLVIIISDGMENASERYDQSTIAETIQTLMKTERWTFTYMGANQDLSNVSAELNIPISNMANYKSTSKGAVAAMKGLSSSTGHYMQRRNRGVSGASQQSNFYSPDLEKAADFSEEANPDKTT